MSTELDQFILMSFMDTKPYVLKVDNECVVVLQGVPMSYRLFVRFVAEELAGVGYLGDELEDQAVARLWAKCEVPQKHVKKLLKAEENFFGTPPKPMSHSQICKNVVGEYFNHLRKEEEPIRVLRSTLHSIDLEYAELFSRE